MLKYEVELPIEDGVEQKEYDYSVIKNAFDKISHFSQIEFNFPQGGCQQRSHVMSLMLEKKFDVEHRKIWLFSPASLYEEDPTTLFVEDKNKLSQDNIVNWNYHTAPIVKLNDGGKTKFLVIDPSLNRNEPLSLEDWLKSIGNSTLGKYTMLSPEKYFFNSRFDYNGILTVVFDGSFFELDSQSKDNLFLEKGLAINDMAIIIYKKYIDPLMNRPGVKDEKRLQDLKDIFGNATTLDLLFAQNLSGNTYQTTYRYVLSNYGAIVREAKQVFYERLLFWTRCTNDLI